MVEAVIFDWGGTLTRWHDIDFHEESLALAQAVIDVDHDVHAVSSRLHAAGETIWGRSRDHQQSATVGDLFDEAGLDHDPELLTAYYEFWEPHTRTDPGGRAAVRVPARRGDQGGCPVQHDLATLLARRVLRARRGGPPDRRRRLHQRDPVDQAVTAGLPGGDGRCRRRRSRHAASTSATVSSTTSGARRTRECERSTSRTARSPTAREDTRRVSRTPSCRASPRWPTWSPAGADSRCGKAVNFCKFVQRKKLQRHCSYTRNKCKG